MCTSSRFAASSPIVRFVNIARSPAPIILIGHSMGGFCALKFAEILEAEGIRVSLVVAIDPAHVTPNVPLNVDRFINIFLSTSVLGGGDVKPKPGYRGHYASFDLSEHDEVTHINIEKMDAVHEQLITKIVQLAMTSAKTEGETVPVRFVVPPNAAIELWDSGMPVFARPGDSLQTIAASLPCAALVGHPDQQGSRARAAGARRTRRRSAPSGAACRGLGAGAAQAMMPQAARAELSVAAGTEPALERDGSKVRRRPRRARSSESLPPCAPSARGRRRSAPFRAALSPSRPRRLSRSWRR